MNNAKLSGVLALCILLLPCMFFAQIKPVQFKLQKNTKQLPAADTSLQKAIISYTIIPAKNSTWGYNIYVDGKLRIHQLTIPAMPGNEGFASKKSAEKVAEKVTEKMRKGESLPTITVEELKTLKAIE